MSEIDDYKFPLLKFPDERVLADLFIDEGFTFPTLVPPTWLCVGEHARRMMDSKEFQLVYDEVRERYFGPFHPLLLSSRLAPKRTELTVKQRDKLDMYAIEAIEHHLSMLTISGIMKQTFGEKFISQEHRFTFFRHTQSSKWRLTLHNDTVREIPGDEEEVGQPCCKFRFKLANTTWTVPGGLGRNYPFIQHWNRSSNQDYADFTTIVVYRRVFRPPIFPASWMLEKGDWHDTQQRKERLRAR